MKIQLTEMSRKNASEALAGKVTMYKELNKLHHRNTVHVSLSFKVDSTRGQMEEAITQLLASLGEEAGCGHLGMIATGVVLGRPTTGGAGVAVVKAHHAHLLVRSSKSRKSGRTVARLPWSSIETIQQSIDGGYCQSFVMEPVYDADSLLSYILGDRNLGAEGSQVFMFEKI